VCTDFDDREHAQLAAIEQRIGHVIHAPDLVDGVGHMPPYFLRQT
jgi:hypothetical protein